MSSVKLALVIGNGDDDENVEVVDLTKIQPLSPNIFLIETLPFKNGNILINGAGEPFTTEQIRFLLSSLSPIH